MNEEREKKLKEICNSNPPDNGTKILLGIIFFVVCPALIILYRNSFYPVLSKHISVVVLQLIFVLMIVVCILCAIPYLHQFFLYKFFPGGFMGLKGPWWDRATARFDLKHNLIGKNEDREPAIENGLQAGKVKERQK